MTLLLERSMNLFFLFPTPTERTYAIFCGYLLDQFMYISIDTGAESTQFLWKHWFVSKLIVRTERYTGQNIFRSPEMKAEVSFSDRLSYVICPSVNFSHFRLLFQSHWEKFNQTWHKASLGKVDSSLFKQRPTP